MSKLYRSGAASVSLVQDTMDLDGWNLSVSKQETKLVQAKG